ncbi:hypothetical protein [Dietzia natronolimnaea]|uniref:hypothetical protein n=1 Tax=Dietzia natronolimnaea TaxID=161920 RepID=UPI0015FC9907|nr:hypothetical protein [Dietzia natronolimnaea]MBB1037361.1 hypothetical protein [Dietzia natronolimnaea]
MTEHLTPSPDFDDIPRRSPSLEIYIHGEPIELTWYNTKYVIYSDDTYSAMAHVKIDQDEGPTTVHFDSLSLIEALMKEDYPGSIYPEPTREVLALYYQYQSYRLDQDLLSLRDE